MKEPGGNYHPNSPKLLDRVRTVLRRQHYALRMQAKPAHRLPIVLSQSEVRALLKALPGTHQLIARLLYGSGLRLMEGLRLAAPRKSEGSTISINAIKLGQGVAR